MLQSNDENIGKLNSVKIDPHRGEEEFVYVLWSATSCCNLPPFWVEELRYEQYCQCELSLVNVVELLANAREAWNAMEVSGVLLSYPNLPNKHVHIWQSPFKGCKKLHNTPMCSWETPLSTTTKIPLVHVLIPNFCNIAGSERTS